MAVSSGNRDLKDIYEKISVLQQELRNLLINSEKPPSLESMLGKLAEQVEHLEMNESKMTTEDYLWCLRALTSDATTNIVYHLEFAEDELGELPQPIPPEKAPSLRHASMQLACKMRRPNQSGQESDMDGWLNRRSETNRTGRGSESSTESLKYTTRRWKGHLRRMASHFQDTTGLTVLNKTGTQKPPRYNKLGLFHIEESKLGEAATKAALEILVFAGKYIPLNVSKLMIIIRYLLKLHDFQDYYECSVWFSNLTVDEVDESTMSKRQHSPWSQDDRIKKLKHMYDSGDYWEYKNLLYDTFFAVLESRFNISRIGDWTRSVIEHEIKAATAAKTCILSHTNDVRFQYNFSPRLKVEDEGLELLHSFVIRRYHTQSPSPIGLFEIDKSMSLTTFLAELKKREAVIDGNFLERVETMKDDYAKCREKGDDITFQKFKRKIAGRIGGSEWVDKPKGNWKRTEESPPSDEDATRSEKPRSAYENATRIENPHSHEDATHRKEPHSSIKIASHGKEPRSSYKEPTPSAKGSSSGSASRSSMGRLFHTVFSRRHRSDRYEEIME